MQKLAFRGEHVSLNAIHNSVPPLLGTGQLARRTQDGSGAFLVTDFSQGGPTGEQEKGSGLSLAACAGQSRVTRRPRPSREGYPETVFGFDVPTCCGDNRATKRL